MASEIHNSIENIDGRKARVSSMKVTRELPSKEPEYYFKKVKEEHVKRPKVSRKEYKRIKEAQFTTPKEIISNIFNIRHFKNFLKGEKFFDRPEDNPKIKPISNDEALKQLTETKPEAKDNVKSKKKVAEYTYHFVVDTNPNTNVVLRIEDPALQIQANLKKFKLKEYNPVKSSTNIVEKEKPEPEKRVTQVTRQTEAPIPAIQDGPVIDLDNIVNDVSEERQEPQSKKTDLEIMGEKYNKRQAEEAQIDKQKIDNLENYVSDLSKYTQFDPASRSEIMMSNLRGDTVAPRSWYPDLTDKELQQIKHINVEFLKINNKPSKDSVLVSADDLEKTFSKKYREKAIVKAKTSKAFYQDNVTVKYNWVLDSFKKLNVNKPSWSKDDPIKAAQTRITRYLSFKNLGLDNHAFHFTRSEAVALSNIGQPQLKSMFHNAIEKSDAVNQTVNQNKLKSMKKTMKQTLQKKQSLYQNLDPYATETEDLQL